MGNHLVFNIKTLVQEMLPIKVILVLRINKESYRVDETRTMMGSERTPGGQQERRYDVEHKG